MTRTQFTLYTALFGTTAIVQPAMAGVPVDEEEKKCDGKKEEHKKCELKVEVDDIKVLEDAKKVKVEGEAMCLDEAKDAKVFVKAKAKALVACANPGSKGHIPPGQPKHWVEFKILGSDEIEVDEKKEDFKVVADAVKDLEDPCKKKWDPKILAVKVTEVEVTVVQDGKSADTKCTVDNKGDFYCP